MTVGTSKLVARLQAAHGDEVRAVASYDRESYDLHYIDSEARANYSPAEMDAIYDDVVLQDLNRPIHEDLFTDIGAVRGKIRLFENGTVAHFWPTGDEDGVFVAFGPGADPGLRSLLNLVEEFYA